MTASSSSNSNMTVSSSNSSSNWTVNKVGRTGTWFKHEFPGGTLSIIPRLTFYFLLVQLLTALLTFVSIVTTTMYATSTI